MAYVLRDKGKITWNYKLFVIDSLTEALQFKGKDRGTDLIPFLIPHGK